MLGRLQQLVVDASEAFGGYFRRVLALGVLSALAAFLEALTVGVLVPTVAALAAEDQVFRTRIEALDYDLEVSAASLLWICTGCIVGRGLIQAVVARFDALMIASWERTWRQRLVSAFLDASWARQAEERVGRLQVLLTENVAQGSRALHSWVTGMVGVSNFAVLVAAAMVVDIGPAIGMCVAAAFLFLLLRPLGLLSVRFTKRRMALNETFASRLNQAVQMAREIRVFAAEQWFEESLLDVIGRLERERSNVATVAGLVPVFYQNAAAMIVVGGLTAAYASGATDLARFGTIALLLIRALAYGRSVQSVYHHMIEGLPYVKQLRVVEERYRAGAVVRPGEVLTTIDELAFSNVTFAYDDGPPVLKGVSFRVGKGETIGIVGPSGAGKSTLVQLLLRLRDPTGGEVRVNGKDVREFSLSSWFSLVTYVPQEPRLFSGSISENVMMYRPGLGRQEVEEAVCEAGLDEELLSMEGGLDSSVGNIGGSLSGGQRQRLSIARALAGSPSAIVFDEPTSALDVHKEAHIQDSLDALRGRCTCFIVAHRLSTLKNCDRVMVLRDGRIEHFAAPSELKLENEYFEDAMRLAEFRA